MRAATALVAGGLAGLLLALAGCGGTPETGVARCPTAPDASVLAALAGSATSGSAPSGAAVFQRECARCHSANLAERASRLFRDYPRLDCADYLDVVSDRYLFTAIAEGGTAVGRDKAMKPFAEKLTEPEIADLVAFLRGGT